MKDLFIILTQADARVMAMDKANKLAIKETRSRLRNITIGCRTILQRRDAELEKRLRESLISTNIELNDAMVEGYNEIMRLNEEVANRAGLALSDLI